MRTYGGYAARAGITLRPENRRRHVPGSPRMTTTRVLIIEDDKDIVELVRYNLAHEGFQVTAIADGASGLAQIRKSPPDVLLLDLMLPSSPAWEICKEVPA